MGLFFSIFILILGLFIGNFGFAQILTKLLFAIPYTKAIKRECNINKKIYIHFAFTITFWSIVIFSIASLIFLFTKDFVTFMIGLGFSFFNVKEFCGYTQSNADEYYNTFWRYIEN